MFICAHAYRCPQRLYECPAAQGIAPRIDKWDYIKLKSSCMAKKLSVEHKYSQQTGLQLAL